jgi:phosphatidate phosphatase PAH1
MFLTLTGLAIAGLVALGVALTAGGVAIGVGAAEDKKEKERQKQALTDEINKQNSNYNQLYETLEENFGDFINISQNNNSPVNQKDSSLIRHNYKDIYEEKILPIDIAIRKKFTSDLVEYFSNNIEELYEFINDMLEKNSSTSKKTKPDRLIILNYNKKSVKEIDLKNFKNNLQFNIRNTDTGIVIGNIRIALSWQNGRGLNNPTIRVFLEE